MGVDDIFFKRNVKLAFSRVKEHILHIEQELKESKEELKKYKEEIEFLKEKIRHSEEDFRHSKEKVMHSEKEFRHSENKHRFPVETQKPLNHQNQGSQDVSSGNEGVYSFIHSFTRHSFNDYAHTKHSLNTNSNRFEGIKHDFEKLFGSLSKQEFLTFLIIYQLEEEITHVSYLDIAKKLNITEGCIRTYVASLLKKGLPLMKKKYNNKQIFLYISPEFRSLNFKQKLLDTFYNNDPNQKRLQDTF